MKIAHVVSTFPPYTGGIGNVAFHNALGLAQAGHDVTVFVPNYVHTQNTKWPFTVRSLHSWLTIGNASVVPGLIKELNGFDIVHVHVPFYGGTEYVWLAHVFHKVPYVVTYHMDVIGDSVLRNAIFKTYDSTVLRWALRGAKRVLAVSDRHLQTTKVWKYLDKNKTTVIPNGVDTDHFQPITSENRIALRQQLDIPAEAFVLTIVAGLDRPHFYKGVDSFLQMVHAMRSTANDVYGVIVGDGPMKLEYETQTQALGIAKYVRFVGQKNQQDLPNYYGMGDLTVMSSHIPESFGLVLAESMACATPVIAIDCPGTQAVVEPNVTGWLVPLNDQVALEQNVLDCYKNRDNLPAIGQAGRQRMQAQFEWNVIIPQLEQLYLTLV